MKRWMIYGANGYTGRLVAEEAKRRGLSPILAGRSSQEIQSLGQKLGFEVRIFGLEDEEIASKNLAGVTAVLHCAGPFSATHRPMYQACLKAKTHYLDITGEIRVFERVQLKRDEIVAAGIVVIPGVGLDVVPSDCLAAMLAQEMPDATHLSLGIKMHGKPSPGTSKTLIEGLSAGGVIRKEGNLTPVKSAFKVRKVRFNQTDDLSVTIPWGDISTAFYSTGIPNIEFYMAASKSLIGFLKVTGPFERILGLQSVQGALKKLVEYFVAGATETERLSSRISFWGEVTNAVGGRVEKRIQTPDGYNFTVDSSLAAMKLVLEEKVKPGPWTPSKAFGPDFVRGLSGVDIQ